MPSLTSAYKKAAQYLGSKFHGSPPAAGKHQVKTVAEQMPLIHVTGKWGIERFHDLLLLSPHEFSVSPGCSACMHWTCESERILELGRNFYLAAGRAFGKFGPVALVFDPQHETSRTGYGNFFDSGELAHGKLNTNFDPHPPGKKLDPPHVKKLRKFVRKHVFPLSSWRSALGKHLAENFSKPSDYFDGEPCTPGPADIFALNQGNCFAWIFEVRFQEGPCVYDATKWNGPSDLMRKLERQNENLPLSSPVVPRLQQFMGRAIIPEGAADSAGLVERSIRNDLRI